MISLGCGCLSGQCGGSTGFGEPQRQVLQKLLTELTAAFGEMQQALKGPLGRVGSEPSGRKVGYSGWSGGSPRKFSEFLLAFLWGGLKAIIYIYIYIHAFVFSFCRGGGGSSSPCFLWVLVCVELPLRVPAPSFSFRKDTHYLLGPVILRQTHMGLSFLRVPFFLFFSVAVKGKPKGRLPFSWSPNKRAK